jgi:hypothetical protein
MVVKELRKKIKELRKEATKYSYPTETTIKNIVWEFEQIINKCEKM